MSKKQSNPPPPDISKKPPPTPAPPHRSYLTEKFRRKYSNDFPHMPSYPNPPPYCSLYILIRKIGENDLFRFPRFERFPYGYEKVTKYKSHPMSNHDLNVYDEQGLLKPEFWGIKRLMPNLESGLKPSEVGKGNIVFTDSEHPPTECGYDAKNDTIHYNGKIYFSVESIVSKEFRPAFFESLEKIVQKSINGEGSDSPTGIMNYSENKK